MLPEVDWSRLYYALVRVHPSQRGISYKVFGVGTTITDAKVNGLNMIHKTRSFGSENEIRRYNKLMDLDLYTKVYLGEKNGMVYYTIMYAESKIYEYSKLWELPNFVVTLDPTVKENVLRFIRARKSGWSMKYVSDEHLFRFVE